jgi:hypothetical protein
MQNVAHSQYRGKTAGMLKVIPQVSVGVCRLASHRWMSAWKIRRPRRMSLEVIGCQPPLWGRLHLIVQGYGVPHQMLGIVSRRPRLQLSACCVSAFAVSIDFIWL